MDYNELRNIINVNLAVASVLGKKWYESQAKGVGAAGMTFERLLNLPNQNFEIPDFNGIEIKTKLSSKWKDVCLIGATPDSYLYEIKRLLDEHGYYDKEYHMFKVFNHIFYANKKTYIGDGKYAKLDVDYDKKVVHLYIYDKNGNIIDNYTSWSFDLLKEKLLRKDKYLILAYAKKKYIYENDTPIELFNYYKYNFYILNDFEKFLKELANGTIYVKIGIGFYKTAEKFGDMNYHGTNFCIDEDQMEKIFTKII